MFDFRVRDVRDHNAHVVAWDEMNRLNHIEQSQRQAYWSFMRYDMNRERKYA